MDSADSAAPGSVPQCPRCAVALVDDPPYGARCPSCGGHHLDVVEAGTLLEREVGRTVDQLKELAGMFAGAKLPCSGCGAKQSPITLRSVPVDLCLSCGALWLDAGELSALTNGRVQENPPPDRALAVQPREAPPKTDPSWLSPHDRKRYRYPDDFSARQWVFGIAALGGAVAIGAKWFYLATPLTEMWLWLVAVPVLAVLAGFRHYLEVDSEQRTVTEWKSVWGLRWRSGATPFDRINCVYVSITRGHNAGGQPEITNRVMIELTGEPTLYVEVHDAGSAERVAIIIAELTGSEFARRPELTG